MGAIIKLSFTFSISFGYDYFEKALLKKIISFAYFQGCDACHRTENGLMRNLTQETLAKGGADAFGA